MNQRNTTSQTGKSQALAHSAHSTHQQDTKTPWKCLEDKSFQLCSQNQLLNQEDKQTQQNKQLDWLPRQHRMRLRDIE
jgi:hypothetical protein